MSGAPPYSYKMTPTYDDSPEVAPGHSLPEVYHQQEAPWSPQQSSVAPTYTSHTPVKQEEPATPAGGYGYGAEAQYQPTPGSTTGNKRKGVVCGCSLVVLVLSIIIAILAAAVIGLAAGTGVAASNYNDANSKLDSLSASYSSLLNGDATATATSASASATSTSYSNITNGCSDKNEKTTGDIYTSDFFNQPSFTMYCNKDTVNAPVLTLFVTDFNGCMDACAAWNFHNASQTDCEAISFIPRWSIHFYAVDGQAPGDCYLKPGPQNETGLVTPNIGTECHAAILDT